MMSRSILALALLSSLSITAFAFVPSFFATPLPLSSSSSPLHFSSSSSSPHPSFELHGILPYSDEMVSTLFPPVPFNRTELALAMVAKAEACVDGSCSVDEVNDVIVALNEQRKDLQERFEFVDKLLKELTNENLVKEEARDINSITGTIGQLARIFVPSSMLGDRDWTIMPERNIGYMNDFPDGKAKAKKRARDYVKPWKPSEEEK